MKEITQTRLGSPYGNCYAACVASIFELDIEKLPRLPEDDELIKAKYLNDSNKDHWSVEDCRNGWWWDMWRDWYAANNLMRFPITAEKISRYDRDLFRCFHIINGRSPRDKEAKDGRGGRMHSVVGLKGVIWFDPYPSREGLISIDEYEIIIPANPVKPILQAYNGVQ